MNFESEKYNWMDNSFKKYWRGGGGSQAPVHKHHKAPGVIVLTLGSKGVLHYWCCDDFGLVSCLRHAAGECRRGGAAVLQWPRLLQHPHRADAVGAAPHGRPQPPAVPHQPGAAAGAVHRGQECLHRDQVPLPPPARRHCARGHPQRLHSRGLWFCVFVSECVCVLIDNFSTNGDHDDSMVVVKTLTNK